MPFITSFIYSLILVLPLILLRQPQQLLELLNPILWHLPCIHQLPTSFHEMHHQHLFRVILGRIPMIRLNEGLHLIVSCQPTSFLIHTSTILPQTSYICRTSQSCKGSYFPSLLSNSTLPLSRHSNECHLAFSTLMQRTSPLASNTTLSVSLPASS